MPVDPTLGEIALFAFNKPMNGWLPCYGQILVVNQYQALYSLLGNYYGGTPGQTFALPDLRGRTPVSAMMSGSPPPGVSSYLLGMTGGQASVTLTTANLPPHTHAMMGTAQPANATSIVDAIYANVATLPPAFPTPPMLYGPPTNLTNFDPTAVQNTGQSQAHQNMQPSLGLCFMIATQGIYPSRP